jgi:tungstate transport system substrate-binding protein
MPWMLLVVLLSMLLACTQRGVPEPIAGSLESGAPLLSARAELGNEELVLATTTSTQDSGLLDVLIPLFENETGYQVKTVSVGTGAALALSAQGNADVVLVHAPQAEDQWMADQNGADRLLVMHNDFVVVGPPTDPAGVRADGSVVGAFTAIATRGATWISRDDNSGTDQLEKQLWNDAQIDAVGLPGYTASGQGMGATLTLADQKDAYTLSDRATYLARRDALQSVILLEGDPQLLNIYHVMPVNAAKFPNLRINSKGARAFADFLIRPATQQLIGEFGRDRFGQPLSFPDAGKSESELRG